MGLLVALRKPRAVNGDLVLSSVYAGQQRRPWACRGTWKDWHGWTPWTSWTSGATRATRATRTRICCWICESGSLWSPIKLGLYPNICLPSRRLTAELSRQGPALVTMWVSSVPVFGPPLLSSEYLDGLAKCWPGLSILKAQHLRPGVPMSVAAIPSPSILSC